MEKGKEGTRSHLVAIPPEHALALTVPMEEERTRRQAEGGGGEDIAAPPLLRMILYMLWLSGFP